METGLEGTVSGDKKSQQDLLERTLTASRQESGMEWAGGSGDDRIRNIL